MAYDWASSERAAWMQALWGEAANAAQEPHAITFLDLTLSSGSSTFDIVWYGRQDAIGGFKTRLPRMILRIYGMVRRIVLDGCHAAGRAWARGIVAGSIFAPVCLKMVLVWEVDQLVYRFPWSELCLFFDDLSLATKGPKEFVESHHP